MHRVGRQDGKAADVRPGDGVEGSVAVSFRDHAGRIVDIKWQRRDAPEGPMFCFESSALAAGVREAIFRVVVRSGGQLLTDHVHRVRIEAT